MDVYHIFDTSLNSWRWRDLTQQEVVWKIVQHRLVDVIGCTDTDTVVTARYGVFWYEYPRSIRVIDQYGRIIPLSEVRIWLNTLSHEPTYQQRVPRRWWCLSQYVFTFRYDPVPGIHRRGWGCWYRRVKKNKRAYVQSLEFPSRRLAKHRALMYTWGDDHPRSIERSWKQIKKRKQWM